MAEIEESARLYEENGAVYLTAGGCRHHLHPDGTQPRHHSLC
jgi:hypothetical protein